MGAKKKGMANRLAKMSDEERARYLQHRADMEEETRRRKEQLISTFLKNKLKKEDGFARLNVAKINQNWHQIMRKYKCKEMKETVEYLKEHMERLIELKNRTINKALKELEDAEEQYTNNLQSHLTHIKKIIDFGTNSLDEMHEIFDRDREELIEIANQDRKEFLMKAFDEQAHLRNIIYQQDIIGKKDLRKEYEYYFLRNDSMIKKNKIEFDKMRQSKEALISDLWRRIASALRDYVDRTDTKRAHLAELQSLDAESAAEIAKNEELIKRQEAVLKKLESEYEEITTADVDEIKFLKNAVESHKKQHLDEKIRHKKELDSDEKRLIILTDLSNTTLKTLEKTYTKGEKILQLMQVCRKLETEREKVLRFTETTNDELEDFINSINTEEDVTAKILETPPQSVRSKAGIIAKIVPTHTITEEDESQIEDVKSTSASTSSGASRTSSSSKPSSALRSLSASMLSKAIRTARSSGSTRLEKLRPKTSSQPVRKYRIVPRPKTAKLEKSESIVDGSLEVLQEMDKFWINYNRVKINTLEMKREHKMLLQENEKMKDEIRMVIEDLALEKIASRIKVEQDLYVREISSAGLCK